MALSVDEQYVALGHKLLAQELKPSRVGNTRGCFAPMPMVFDLQDDFPLLQCKHVWWKKSIGELLWMVGGHTDAGKLHEKEYGASKIWDDDAEKFAVRKKAFEALPWSQPGPYTGPNHMNVWKNESETDLGLVYGYQWRSWGGGHDQLKAIVDLLRKEPSSRRAMVTAYNPYEHDMNNCLAALPPCHMFWQASCRGNSTDLSMVQRSADFMLGLPFNICNYAALTMMLASVLGTEPGIYTHLFSGDVHVYEAHRETVEEMFSDWKNEVEVLDNGEKTTSFEPRKKLKLVIAPGNRQYLHDFKLVDFSLVTKSVGEPCTPYDDLKCTKYQVKLLT